MVCNLIAARHVRTRVCPAVAVDQPVARHQNVIASGERHSGQRRRAAILTALIKIDGRLHAAGFLVDGTAVNVTEQGVEDVAGYLLTRHHVKIAVIGLYISETLEPFVLFQPSGFFFLDLTHTRGGFVRERFGWRYLVHHRRHALRD